MAGFGFWGMYLVIYMVQNPLAPGAGFCWGQEIILLALWPILALGVLHMGRGGCLGIRPVTVLEAPGAVQLRELVSF